MRLRLLLPAIVALTAGLVPAGPANAQTAYEMFGSGELATEDAGLAFCPLVCDPNDSNVYTFATLPIQGYGVLLGEPVAATYQCPSNVTVNGDTSNFTIDWQFTCTRDAAGVGPAVISGHFGSVGPALLLFQGEFYATDERGNTRGPASSICSGGIVPTRYDAAANRVKAAYFAGECTSAGA